MRLLDHVQIVTFITRQALSDYCILKTYQLLLSALYPFKLHALISLPDLAEFTLYPETPVIFRVLHLRNLTPGLWLRTSN